MPSIDILEAAVQVRFETLLPYSMFTIDYGEDKQQGEIIQQFHLKYIKNSHNGIKKEDKVFVKKTTYSAS